MFHAWTKGAYVSGDFSFVGNTGAFAFQLGRLRDAIKKGLIDPDVGTLSKQAQLLCEDCINATPPKGMSEGKKRVQNDMQKIFHPLDPAQFTSKGIQSLIRRSDMSAWNAAATSMRSGPLAGTQAVNPTEQLHTANRDRRGRAKKTNFVTLWKQRGAFKSLLKSAQERVGWAKAGWLRGYLALRGTRAPAWVTRHGLAKGQFIDGRIGGDTTKWFIEVYNDTGWGNRADNSQQIVNVAIRARTHAMESYFNNQMRLASESFGKAA